MGLNGLGASDGVNDDAEGFGPGVVGLELGGIGEELVGESVGVGV